jgi:signal transduction histidine kinase/ligand-binding sensor domain-containing protein
MASPRSARGIGVFLFLTLSALSAEVRGEKLPVRTFTVEDGLPENRVSAFFQDSRGFLWVATSGGLARFDGRRFESYRSDAGLPSNAVTALAEERDGTLLVGTTKGLARMAAAEERPLAVSRPFRPIPVEGSPVPIGISAIFPDGKGGFLCTSSDGLFRLIGERLIAVPLPIRPDAEAGGSRTLFDGLRDPEGRLWLGAASGLYRVSPSGSVDRFGESDGLPQAAVVRLLRTGEGRLFAGTPLGAVELRPDARSGERIAARPIGAPGMPSKIWVNGLVESWDGEIWMSSDAGLLSLRPGRKGEPDALRFLDRRNGLPEGEMTCVFEDREGVIWIGGEASGATRVTKGSLVRWDREDGLEVVRALGFLEGPSGEVVVSGTVDRGRELDRFDGARFRAVRPRQPEGLTNLGWGWGEIDGIDRQGSWWVLAGEAVLGWRAGTRLDELEKRPPSVVLRTGRELPSREGFRLHPDRSGDLWISLLGDPSKVLARRVGSSGRIVLYGPERGVPLAAPTAFAEDDAGNLWIGFYDGSFRRRVGERFERVGPDRGPTGGLVSDLRVGADGSLWLATFRGLAHVESPTSANPRIRIFGEVDGLASTAVSSVAEAGEGRLFVGGPRGIDLFDPGRGVLRHIGVGDGLPSSSVVALHRDRTGDLWVGTILGTARLRLAPAPPRSPLRVFIESIRVAGEPVPLPPIGRIRVPERRLAPSEDRVEIGFVAPTSGLDETVRYQFRLLGAGDAWSVPAADRIVRLAHLAPGSYCFEVRAVASGGRASVESASFSFVLPPPFWQRRSVVLSSLLAALALVTILHRLRFAAARAESHRLERIVGERTEDLRQAKLQLEESNRDLEQRVAHGIGKLRESERFAAWGRLVTTVAHEIRHPIFAIRSVSWFLAERFREDGEAAPHFRTIDREADRMTALMDELLEFARPAAPVRQPTDIPHLFDDAVETYRLEHDPARLAVRLEVAPGLPEVPLDRTQLLRVLANLMQNAFRHAVGATGIVLRAGLDREGPAACLRIDVANDGEPIPPEIRGRLFEPFFTTGRGTGLGLAIVQRVVLEHGGTIEVDSPSGGGSLFRVRLPLEAAIETSEEA